MTNKIFKKNESVIRIQAERSDQIRTNVVFFSHDKGTAKLIFRLEKDNAPQPLPAGTEVPIHLSLIGADVKTHIYYASIDDAAAGLVSIILKDDTLRHQGRVEGSIYIKPPNDQHLDSSGRFLFNIERSPIDDISQDASQFYYEGFTTVYDQIAEVRKIVSTMTTEAQAAVNENIRDLEAQIDRFLQDAQSKFTSLDSDIAAVRQTVTQLENRLTTVKNEIEALANSLEFGGRNYLRDSESPKMTSHSGATVVVTPNQTVEEWRATNAVRHEVSGGTSTTMGTLSAGRTVTPNARYIHSVFIKNIGTTNVRVNNNLGGVIIVVPGESKRIVFPSGRSPAGVASMQLGFVRDRVEDNCDFILWRAMIAQGNVVGDWVPNPDELVLKNVVDISARNLAPNSSFYNDMQGWSIPLTLSATSTGSYTRIVKSEAQTARATIFRSISDDRFKPNTSYTIGLMVYVESISGDYTVNGSNAFLRTTSGTIKDSSIANIDFSKKGEWQLVTGTGITSDAPWTANPQLVIAFQAAITCAVRIKEFVIVEGSKYLGWFPDSAEMALKKDLEETHQKVQTLEENTIRLTNYFPDYNFQKQTPQPAGENGVTFTYDGQGVVFRNSTDTQGRVHWAAPLLGLLVGKTYNVSMYLNVGTESYDKEFEVGTSLGDNFTVSAPNTTPIWKHGTIGLTNWAAFSIWLPPNSTIRLRELYIYEANTDITTARIEQIENSIRTPTNRTIFDGANWFLEGHSYNYNIDELAEGILLVWSRFTVGEGAHEFGFHETFINKHTIAMYDGRPRYANMPDSINTINKSFVVTPSRVYGHADNGNNPRNAWALRKIILM